VRSRTVIESALTRATVDTGCILECLLDEEGYACVSCGRTLKEIRDEGLKRKREEANEQRQTVLSPPDKGV